MSCFAVAQRPQFYNDALPFSGTWLRWRVRSKAVSLVHSLFAIAMAASLEDSFEALAQRSAVSESTFLLLKQHGITSCSAFFFRVPSLADVDEFVRHGIAPFDAWEESPADGSAGKEIKKAEKLNWTANENRSWTEFKFSPEAGSIRQLWEAAKIVAKRQLEAGEDGSSERKISAAVAASMLKRAVDSGMPEPAESEVPGKLCLTKVSANLAAGGPFSYLAWGSYTTASEESRAERMGYKADRAFSLKLGESEAGARSVGLKSVESEIVKFNVGDLVTLQDTLRVRSFAHRILNLVAFEVYEAWTAVLIRALKQDAHQSMRRPTMAEVRLADRLVHEAVLRYASARTSTVEKGLKYFGTDAGKGHELLQVLRVQAEHMPCQGVESRAQIAVSGGSSLDGKQIAASGLTLLTLFCMPPRPPQDDNKNDGKGGKAGKSKGKGKGNDGKGGKSENKKVWKEHVKVKAGEEAGDKKDG